MSLLRIILNPIVVGGDSCVNARNILWVGAILAETGDPGGVPGPRVVLHHEGSSRVSCARVNPGISCAQLIISDLNAINVSVLSVALIHPD